jgi:predicted lactoylglutathione lyase
MTEVSSIYINLPVNDLTRSRQFWTALGFSFNELYSDDKVLCLVLRESAIYSMLMLPEVYKNYTNRPLADGSTTQVILAIQVESKARVDEIVKLAMEQGASRYKEPVDYGWMYYDSFVDPDGHQWEVMYADPEHSS